MGDELVDNFLLFKEVCKGENKRKVSHVIWLAIVWSIWFEHNDVLSKGKIGNILMDKSIILFLMYIVTPYFPINNTENNTNVELGCYI
jgi:hypothetical protein